MVVCSLGGQPKADCKPCSHDAITLSPLEESYVEFITPDGKTRLCYNASTLHRIRRYGYLTQPPHFRFRMCRKDEQKVLRDFPELPQRTEEAVVAVSRHRMNRYLMTMETAYRRMESKTLYVCPVAWTQLTCGALESNQYDEIWSKRVEEDPLLLCHRYIQRREQEGEDGFTELAAVFHTTKSKALQQLRVAYQVDTRGKFSTLLDRYSMRGADGIVHNYLTSMQGRGHGDMLSYWSRDFYYHKSLYMSLWLYNTTEHARVDRRLPVPEYSITAARDIMNHLENIVAPSVDSDDSFIADTSEEEESDAEPKDTSSSAAAHRKQEELSEYQKMKADRWRQHVRQKRRERRERKELERRQQQELERRRRKERLGAAAVMYDSDEEDVVPLFDFALRF